MPVTLGKALILARSIYKMLLLVVVMNLLILYFHIITLKRKTQCT